MSEIGLFIIWDKSRCHENEILQEIKKNNFQILKQYEIYWDKEKFNANMDCFYGDNLSELFCKKDTIGDGAFRLIIVEDKKPVYEVRKTSLGEEKVNVNFFDFKWYIRNTFFESKPFFHGTNTLAETNRDLTLLIGKNIEDFTKSVVLDGKLDRLERDLPAVSGWKNLEEIFYVLNNTVKYVVLRGEEKLPDNFHWYNGDIDLLVEDLQAVRTILEANTQLNHNQFICRLDIKVGNEEIVFHIKYLGDDYFCEKMQQDILDTRVLNEKNIYIPNDEMYFYSLIYHGIIHKRNYRKYEEIFNILAGKLKINKFQNNVKFLSRLLGEYMKKKNYTYTMHTDIWRGFYKQNVYYKNLIDKDSWNTLYYYNFPLYGTLIFSKKAIICCPILLSTLLRKVQVRFPSLSLHKLPKESKLYKIHHKKSKKQFIWVYRNLFGRILRTTYFQKKMSILPVKENKERTIYYQYPADIYIKRKIIGWGNAIKSEYLTIRPDKERCLLSGEIVNDRLQKIRSNMQAVINELQPYVEALFKQFKIKGSDLLSRNAFDALPHNTMIYNGKYYFFDKKITFNYPLKKSYMLFRICERNHLLVDKRQLYKYFCSKFNIVPEYEFDIIYLDEMVHRLINSSPKDNLSPAVLKIIKVVSQLVPKKGQDKFINCLKKLFCFYNRKLFKIYFRSPK